MANKKTPIKLGIFIFIGVSILIVTVFLIGEKQSLFSSTFKVKSYFTDIQGLKEGATVRLSGIDAGSVSDISIVPDNSGRIVVTMDLIQDVRRFIRIDTKASIETEGLVGNKVVILKINSASTAAFVKDNGFIQSELPPTFSQIIAETQGILEYTKNMTKNLAEITAKVNSGQGTVGKLLNDESLYNSATDLTVRADTSLRSITNQFAGVSDLFNKLGKGVEKVVGNVDRVVSNVDSMLASVKSGHGVVGKLFAKGSSLDTSVSNTIKNLEQTTEEARTAASKLSENMEALKHNWLFKSYFEKRGYWDAGKSEEVIDSKIKELNDKIKSLDIRIEELKSLEGKKSSK